MPGYTAGLPFLTGRSCNRMEIPHPLTIISPHLEDAVFSCGSLLAASRRAMVITVFAGLPDRHQPARARDSAAGFSSARQAMEARRQEDARALATLGAQPVWLDFLSQDEGPRYDPVTIAVRLGRLLALQPGSTILAPMGLRHADHMLVNAACMLVREAAYVDVPETVPSTHPTVASSFRWIFYEEAIHRRVPGALQSRMAGWWQEGLLASPVHMPVGVFTAQKARAVQAYESQLGLFSPAQLADVCAPERYWSLDAADLVR